MSDIRLVNVVPIANGWNDAVKKNLDEANQPPQNRTPKPAVWLSHGSGWHSRHMGRTDSEPSV